MPNKKSIEAYGPPHPNAVATQNNETEVTYVSVAKDRTHVLYPGDKLTCPCCGIADHNNMIQHQAGQCQDTIYWQKLLEKTREGYLYLLQRHKENPTIWGDPGVMLMFKPEYSRMMQTLFTRDKLEMQDVFWNVLLPIKVSETDGPNGGPLYRGYFVNHLVELAACKNSVGDDNALFMCQFNDRTGNRDGELVQDWNHHHSPNNSTLSYEEKHQVAMEDGRVVKKGNINVFDMRNLPYLWKVDRKPVPKGSAKKRRNS